MKSNTRFQIIKYFTYYFLPSFLVTAIFYLITKYELLIIRFISSNVKLLLMFICILLSIILMSLLINKISNILKEFLSNIIKLSVAHAIIDFNTIHKITFDRKKSLLIQNWLIYDNLNESRSSLEISFHKEIWMDALYINTDDFKGFGIQYPDKQDLKLKTKKCCIHIKCNKHKDFMIYFHIQGQNKIQYVEYNSNIWEFVPYDFGNEPYLCYPVPGDIKDGKWHFNQLNIYDDFIAHSSDQFDYIKNIKIRGPVTIGRIDFCN